MAVEGRQDDHIRRAPLLFTVVVVRLVFGTNAQGWNDVSVEIELESILQQVQRGTWAAAGEEDIGGAYGGRAS